jgi:hypothetical protein
MLRWILLFCLVFLTDSSLAQSNENSASNGSMTASSVTDDHGLVERKYNELNNFVLENQHNTEKVLENIKFERSLESKYFTSKEDDWNTLFESEAEKMRELRSYGFSAFLATVGGLVVIVLGAAGGLMAFFSWYVNNKVAASLSNIEARLKGSSAALDEIDKKLKILDSEIDVQKRMAQEQIPQLERKIEKSEALVGLSGLRGEIVRNLFRDWAADALLAEEIVDHDKKSEAIKNGYSRLQKDSAILLGLASGNANYAFEAVKLYAEEMKPEFAKAIFGKLESLYSVIDEECSLRFAELGMDAD